MSKHKSGDIVQYDGRTYVATGPYDGQEHWEGIVRAGKRPGTLLIRERFNYEFNYGRESFGREMVVFVGDDFTYMRRSVNDTWTKYSHLLTPTTHAPLPATRQVMFRRSR
jgi:hypothetical protein